MIDEPSDLFLIPKLQYVSDVKKTIVRNIGTFLTLGKAIYVCPEKQRMTLEVEIKILRIVNLTPKFYAQWIQGYISAEHPIAS